MRLARSVANRIAFTLLRLAATCMTMAAAGLTVAAAAAWTIDAEAAQFVGIASIQVATVFAFAGGTALYLVWARTTWLPDGTPAQASTGSSLDGWLILFPLTLAGMSLLLASQLQPLAAFWRDVFALANQLNVWEEVLRGGGLSGIVLMPVFAALALPGLEVLAAAAYVLEALLLLVLLFLRSSRVPRALILCVLIQGGLVGASLRGATVVERIAPSIEQLIRETPDPGGTEQTRALDALQRYRVVTEDSSRTLAVAWLPLATWTPLLLLSGRPRTAFAPDPSEADAMSGALPHLDPQRVSALPEDARARAYVQAAKQIDETTPPSRWF
jgi:hypothetical protein